MRSNTKQSFAYPRFTPATGYMTDQIQRKYLHSAIEKKLLPTDAPRMANIISLTASDNLSQPIQFWQLYSVVGQSWIVDLVTRFYKRVFADEPWFSSVFERIGGLDKHVNSQAGMWIDVMGGGRAYHGGEYRLSFHHYHNAIELMNDRGAQRWVQLMADTLNEPDIDWTDDPRVRPALNTFLAWFMGKYAEEFDFTDRFQSAFGETNPAVKRKINFMKMSETDIAALDEDELKDALLARRVDISHLSNKQALVNKALSL